MIVREHFQSEIGLTEDEYSVSVGVAGSLSGQRFEAIVQISKELSQQDIGLGHDKSYFDYNGLGGYGLIDSVTVSNSENPSILIRLDKEAAKEVGIPTNVIVFLFESAIDDNATEKLKEICKLSETSFQAE